jgi:hypothetical protein
MKYILLSYSFFFKTNVETFKKSLKKAFIILYVEYLSDDP